ncbi:MAG: hypothetical protein IKW13_08450, partial [Thermoguttaceae bacterium]|nr:hypothetical protein [Thermoguttaceae bacterium]
ELTEECQWIYAQMKEHYLWNDSIKQPARSKFFSKSSDFYKSLLQKEFERRHAPGAENSNRH